MLRQLVADVAAALRAGALAVLLPLSAALPQPGEPEPARVLAARQVPIQRPVLPRRWRQTEEARIHEHATLSPAEQRAFAWLATNYREDHAR